MLRMLIATFVIGTTPLYIGLCGGGGDGNPPQGGSATEFEPAVYEIEADWQIDKKPYGGWGSSAVQSVFGDSVSLRFKEDEDTLPQSWIRIHKLADYYSAHRQVDTTTSDSRYPYYLCGITQLMSPPPDSIPYNGILGITLNDGKPYKSYSYVCLEAGWDQCPMDNDVALKTCSHELGHQLFSLTHLCLYSQIDSAWYMDGDNHDDRACLMALSCEAECTGENVITNLHFCDICQDRINTTQK